MGNDMIDYIGDNEIPVFIINGFLEAGKTSFIQYTMSEEYFQIEGNTLLIVCEEGEVEYQSSELARAHTKLVQIENEEDLEPGRMEELRQSFNAERVIIEYNGMWDPTKLVLPEGWVLYQQITIFNGATLTTYLNNMKALMGPMLRNTELCIVNRCDDRQETELLDWKRKLRPMLVSESAIVMENKYGEIPLETLPEELPYDLEAPVIEIKPEDFGIWFFDAKDNPDRYKGKIVSFTACIMRSRNFQEDCFVPGRMAMTCCEADMTFIGFIAHYADIDAFPNHGWVKLRAKMDVRYQKEYGGEGPFLEVIDMSLTGEIKEPVAF